MARFEHDGISADFGYIWCSSCGGNWEGPSSPDNSPCDRVAQAIRDITGQYEYLRDFKSPEHANAYRELMRYERPLAFTSDGHLMKVYWNDDGSTL